MTAIEITVLSVVIIFGFAAWLIARKRGADEWQKAYAKKLTDQHKDATMAMANGPEYDATINDRMHDKARGKPSASAHLLGWYGREINRVKAELAVAIDKHAPRAAIRARLTRLVAEREVLLSRECGASK